MVPLVRFFGSHVYIDDISLSAGLPQSARTNLIYATKLRDVEFTLWCLPQWVIMTLRTITHNHRELEQITLCMCSELGISSYELDIRGQVGENTYQEWLELDRLLVQLCKLHLIHLKVLYSLYIGTNGNWERRWMKILLLEVMTRGMEGWCVSHSRLGLLLQCLECF